MFVTPPYVREETLFSYLSRVARANCFADVRDFFEYGLCLERTDRKVRRDCCEMGVEDSVFYKGDGDLIRDSGLFDILGPFCSRGYISSIVRQLNYRDRPDSEKLLIPPVPSMMSKPKICPKCLEEHRNLTDVIFFRIHQIPGIKVCPIHGCPLLEYDGEPGHELELDRYSVITGTTEEDLKDASFIAGIMERNPDTSLDLVTAAARNRLSGRYPTSLIMNVAGFVEKDPVFARAMAVNGSLLTTFLTKNRKRQISSETLIPFLRILFQDDVDAFIEETKDPLAAETEDRFMETVSPRYRLLSDYSGGLVFLEDTETGYRFHTTPHTVLTGWPMPEKGLVLDADKLMPILVRNNIPKKFVLDSGFKGWYMKLDLKDLEQGGFRSVRAYEVVDHGYTGTNVSTPKKDDTAEKVESSGHFSLISKGTKKTSYTLTIKCLKCGETFKVASRNFFDSPFCRICEKPKRMDNDYAREKIDDLTDGQYRWTGDVGTKLFSAVNVDEPEDIVETSSFPNLTARLKRKCRQTKGDGIIAAIMEVIRREVEGHRGRIFFSKDFADLGYNVDVNTAVCRMYRRGILKKLSAGVFCNPDEHHSAEEVAEARYGRSGINHGIPACDSLMRILGLPAEDENIVYVLPQDRRTTAHVDRRNICGESMTVLFYKGEITEENWRSIALLTTIERIDLMTGWGLNQKALLFKWAKESGITKKMIEYMEPYFKADTLEKAASFLEGGVL